MKYYVLFTIILLLFTKGVSPEEKYRFINLEGSSFGALSFNVSSVDMCKEGPRITYVKKKESRDVYSSLFYGDNSYEKLEKNLTEGWKASETESSISKDCENIAFVSTKDGTKDIWLMIFDGDYQENLIEDIQNRDNCRECYDDVNPDFSRDGKTIFFSRCVPDSYEEPGHVKNTSLSRGCHYQLVNLDIKTKKIIPVLNSEWNTSDVLDVDTFYESDQILFSSNRFGAWQVFISDYHGKVRQVTELEKDAIYPKVSFDDRYIVFNLVDYVKSGEFSKPKEKLRVLIMETSGSNMRELKEGAKPFWLPLTFKDYVIGIGE